MIEKNTGITHEKAVVACLLANTEAITNVIGFLKADMFSSRELGFIYKAIVHLFEQGKRTNYNLIDRTMQEMDRELFLQMNGLAYDPELFTMARDSSPGYGVCAADKRQLHPVPTYRASQCR